MSWPVKSAGADAGSTRTGGFEACAAGCGVDCGLATTCGCAVGGAIAFISTEPGAIVAAKLIADETGPFFSGTASFAGGATGLTAGVLAEPPWNSVLAPVRTDACGITAPGCCVPHAPQKRAPASSAFPHLTHFMVASLAHFGAARPKRRSTLRCSRRIGRENPAPPFARSFVGLAQELFRQVDPHSKVVAGQRARLVDVAAGVDRDHVPRGVEDRAARRAARGERRVLDEPHLLHVAGAPIDRRDAPDHAFDEGGLGRADVGEPSGK